MRVAVMLLVLANLGFFAWQHWYGAEAEVILPAGRVDTGLGKGLLLVGENGSSSAPGRTLTEPSLPEGDQQPPLEQPAQKPEASEQAATDAVVACATLGPFEQLEIARLARDRLNTMLSGATIREAGGQIRSGFWVYLPPFVSRDEAERVEDELREKGVHDLFIVADDEQRNAISLGLFSTPERADQRAARIGRLGYTPRVAERFRDAVVYWVDFREPAGDPLEPESLGVMAAGAYPEKRDIPCAGVAEGAPGA